LFVLAALPAAALAADAFPRGPGSYFSFLKLFAVVLVYLSWVGSCCWVSQDAKVLQVDNNVTWNSALVGCGVLGLVAYWLLPWFFLGFPLLLALYLTPSLLYVNFRNQLVPPDERVLTERHLRELARNYLKLRFGGKEGEREATGPPIRFISKGARQDEDPAKLARAQKSKGYKAAAEVVYEAIKMRATDIHMEPTRDEMSVRYRIDGILQPGQPFSRAMGDAVINIFKVICTMDITEKRKPQDGSCSAQVEDRIVDFRVATAGSVAGEKLVMRILDKSKQVITLTQLGMRDKLREQVHQIVEQPHGMFIVCGPTGAGKSTTLYACLNEIDRFQRNVITVENPVEMQIDNVTQIEVNPKAGKTFASELRSILRQDPDVIMIGEIRDAETAEIACQAAQTGHMVFTTVHANDTVTALVRLIDLGVAGFTVGSAVSAVLGQRLVRVLCPHCKVRYKPNADMLRKANLPADKIKFFYRPAEPSEVKDGEEEDGEGHKICPHCSGTGYHGRTGIFELLVVTDRMRELIRDDPNPNLIKQEAVKNGMKYLQEDGLRQVIEGKTSIQELLRVCK
jgi:type II secretory ATPase GspE/PulE/Tfp pilus assembly ATPase PilB-like protein